MKSNKKAFLFAALLVLCAVIGLALLSAASGDNYFASLFDSLSEAADGDGTSAELSSAEPAVPDKTAGLPDRDGIYSSKEEVALYLHTYGCLPSNYITKAEAEKLGWTGGGLDSVAYGKTIGGDRFGTYEGLLPEKSGRVYYECDIDTLHAAQRGAKRIVFSNDGLIFYTSDHYDSFEQLY